MSTSNSLIITDQTIRLHDGRLLGYAVCGDPNGKPLFLFHGWPASRLEIKLVDEKAAKTGFRVIGIDRPGMGISDFKPNRQILDWPNDVVVLADALDIDRFAVLGISGGGPYAAACAYKIPKRLSACGILAGLGPICIGTKGMNVTNRAIFFIARRLSWLLRPAIWLLIGRHREDKEKAKQLISKMMQKYPKPDRVVLDQPELERLIVEDILESFRQGVKGPGYEGRLYGRPWGFRLEDINFDRVCLWHGELDSNVPVAMGRAMAKTIPNCRATFYTNDAHISIIFNRMEEIMLTLLT